MSPVRIEYARPAHTEQIDALESRSFTVAPELLVSVARSRRRDPGVRLVALHEDRVVGYVASTWFYERRGVRDRSLWIIALAVESSFRRGGIGRSLVTALLERGSVRGAVRVHLSVQDENAGAIALYESCGFARSTRKPALYGPGRDGLLMFRTSKSDQRGSP